MTDPTASQPKWPEGPWSVQTGQSVIASYLYIYSNDGGCLCQVRNICDPRDTRGIANLLAMAPDFAAEAQTLVDWWDDDEQEKPALPLEVGHALIRLRHILRMARGET